MSAVVRDVMRRPRNHGSNRSMIVFCRFFVERFPMS
jgi:hypothetical protein